MSDLDTFTQLMNRLHIEFEVNEAAWGNGTRPGGKRITFSPGDQGVKGYTGFFCEWNFDPDGAFIDVGIWE